MGGSQEGDRDPDDYEMFGGGVGDNKYNPRMFSAAGSRSFGEDSMLSVSRLSDGKVKMLRMQSGTSFQTRPRSPSEFPVTTVKLDPTLVRELEVTRAVTRVLDAVNMKIWERTLEVKLPNHVSG